MYINTIDHKKNHFGFPPVTLVFKYIWKISYFVMYLFQHKYISYVQICKCLLEFLFK
jgi:hypothetical protein